MAEDDDLHIGGFVFGIGDFAPDFELIAKALVDFGPGFDDLFGTSVTMARELKESVVVNGPEDLPIMAQVVTDTGSLAMPVQEMCDGLDIRPPESLAFSLQLIRQTFGPPIAVMVLMETVYRRYDNEEGHESPQPGELAEAFNRGDPSIHEALVVTIATRDRFVSEFMPFHYGDGSVAWDEGSRFEIEGWPEVELHERVAEAIQVAFRQEGGTDGTG